MITTQLKRILLSAAVVAGCMSTASALPLSYYNQNSLLSVEGSKWVKIKVEKSGIQQISFDHLREWGFNDPTKVKVYGFSASNLADNIFSENIPDDICPQYSFISPENSRLFFYGVSDYEENLRTNTSITVKRNLYCTAGYYFLTDSPEAPAAPSPENIRFYSDRPHLTTHSSMVYIENEVENPATGGTFFFDRIITSDNPLIYNFQVKDFEATSDFTGNLIYRFATNWPKPMTMVSTSVNNHFAFANEQMVSVSYQSGSDELYFRLSDPKYRPLKATELSSTAGNWEVSFAPGTNIGNSYSALDFAALIYSRKNTMEGNSQMMMYFPNINGSEKNFRVTGITPNTQIWNIDNTHNPRPYITYFDGTSTMVASFLPKIYDAANGAARVMVFDPAKQQYEVTRVTSADDPTIGEDGFVKHQNLHGEEVPDMVIIATDKLFSEAERLADLHKEYQGLDVKVVDPMEIFNEFSSGTPTAMGIRRYAKMLYDRNPEKFRFLLLFGLGSWDNRHIIIPNEDFLITYQAEFEDLAGHEAKCFVSDAYFGFLNDNFSMDESDFVRSLMNINVSRMPVNNLSDARIVVDKIENYLTNPPINGTYNQALLFADDGDKSDHIIHSERVAQSIQLSAPATTISRVYNAIFPWQGNDPVIFREALKAGLTKGLTYLCYTGHGRSDLLGRHERLWSLAEVESTNYSIPPFTMLSTCSAFAYDRKAGDFACNMMTKENGGAINVIGACSAVYKQYNIAISEAVGYHYFAAKAGDFTGDVFRRARNEAVSNGYEIQASNTLCYNMAGDPALPIYAPSYSVRTDKINGEILTAESGVQHIYPLAPLSIEGSIVDEEGNVVSDYNGSVMIDIYDGPRTIYSDEKAVNNEDVGYSQELLLDETRLTAVMVEVTNGHFAADFTIPEATIAGVSNRISYYASTSGKVNKKFATGVYRDLCVNTYDEEKAGEPDTEAPTIVSFYLDDKSFANGDEVMPEVTAYVNIAPDATGINVGGYLGAGAHLVLDGSNNLPGVNNAITLNTDGSASLEYCLNELSDGRHTLEFDIADNAGNRVNETISFTVVNRHITADLVIDCDPVRDNAEFSLTHNFSHEPSGRLIIEDNAGNMVSSTMVDSFPYTWDATSVPDGSYKAYVVLRQDKQFGETAKIPFVVIK